MTGIVWCNTFIEGTEQLEKIEELKDLKRQSNVLYYIVLTSTYVGSLILYLIVFNYLI